MNTNDTPQLPEGKRQQQQQPPLGRQTASDMPRPPSYPVIDDDIYSPPEPIVTHRLRPSEPLERIVVQPQMQRTGGSSSVSTAGAATAGASEPSRAWARGLGGSKKAEPRPAQTMPPFQPAIGCRDHMADGRPVACDASMFEPIHNPFSNALRRTSVDFPTLSLSEKLSEDTTFKQMYRSVCCFHIDLALSDLSNVLNGRAVSIPNNLGRSMPPPPTRRPDGLSGAAERERPFQDIPDVLEDAKTRVLAIQRDFVRLVYGSYWRVDEMSRKQEEARENAIGIRDARDSQLRAHDARDRLARQQESAAREGRLAVMIEEMTEKMGAMLREAEAARSTPKGTEKKKEEEGEEEEKEEDIQDDDMDAKSEASVVVIDNCAMRP